jgi:hypothetical protein
MAGFYIIVPILLGAALLRIILAVRAEFKEDPITKNVEERKSWSRRRIVTVVMASIGIIAIIIGVAITPFARDFGDWQVIGIFILIPAGLILLFGSILVEPGLVVPILRTILRVGAYLRGIMIRRAG